MEQTDCALAPDVFVEIDYFANFFEKLLRAKKVVFLRKNNFIVYNKFVCAAKIICFLIAYKYFCKFFFRNDWSKSY